MRRAHLVLLLACGCGGPASSTATPAVVAIPSVAPVATASAAPSSSATAVARELEQLDTAVRGALGSSTARPADVPLGRLDSAAPSGATPTRGIGSGGQSTVSLPGAPVDAAGDAGKVKGPIAKVAVVSPTVKGTIADAPAVIATMTAGFRRCFSKGLQQDPSMKGSLTITAAIGPHGEVLSAVPSGSGLSGTVIACVAARVASAQFAPPDGGSATVIIPITFTPDFPPITFITVP